MENVIFCVFCKSKNVEKVIVFSDETLQKCKKVLKIRQNNKLKYQDIILPSEVSHTEGYHSRCYSNFTALSGRYKQELSSNYTESQSSSNIPSAHAGTSREIDTEDLQSQSEETIYSENNGEQIRIAENISQTQHSEHQKVDFTIDMQNVCLFCLKARKKLKGKEETLSAIDKNALAKSIEKYLEYIGDTEVYKSLKDHEVLKGHRSCRREYMNSLRLFDDQPQTEFHKKLQHHEEAFRYICSFIDDNIIQDKKFYFFSELSEYYLDCLEEQANADGISFNRSFNKEQLEAKLRKKYGDDLIVTVMHKKKIVGPQDRQIDDNTFELLQKKDIIHKAANILRRKIFDIKNNELPESMHTSDILKGEYSIPQSLTDFYVTLVGGLHSTSRKSAETTRLANSLSEDVIYNVTEGKIKTKKHLALALTLKSLTGSRKVVDIINRYGHCCSYQIAEELEPEATITSSKHSAICPEDIEGTEALHTGVDFDNLDRFVDTSSEKDTLNDTVGIIYQNIKKNVVKEDCFDVDEDISAYNQESSATAESSGPSNTGVKRKRRSIEQI